MKKEYNNKKIKFLFFILNKLKLTKIFAPIYSGQGAILMFHRVLPDNGKKRILRNKSLEITPEFLEQTILYFLNNGYEIISLSQLYDRLSSRTLNKKFIVFTFDDGYFDNYEYAYPVFKKYNVPFTVYVTTCFPDKTAVFWWYMLEDLILQNDNIEIDINGVIQKFNLDTDTKKAAAFNKLRLVIMENIDNNKTEVINFFNNHGIKSEDYNYMSMNWEQVKYIAKDDIVTIAAHTLNHPQLNTLSENQVIKEIKDSKDRLEKELGITVEHFSYPYGSKLQAGKREFKIVKELGFKTAVTTRIAPVFKEHGEHLECLPRLKVGGIIDSLENINTMITGTIPALNNRLRRVITD